MEEDMEEVEEGMEVAMGVMAEEEEGMGTAKRREKLTPSLKLMLLLKPMPITVMEAMEADMEDTVMVDTEDTDMAVNADLLSLDTDMVDMVVMEDTDMEAMVMADMATMDKLVRINVHKPHSDR